MSAIREIRGEAIADAFSQLCDLISDNHKATDQLFLASIADGGVPVGKKLVAALSSKLGREIHCGVLNISFERDDLGRNPIPKDTVATTIPMSVDGATVILIDDVLFSGRTVRAALNELFSQGRPARVELAVLADRGHRRLPVHADYVGMTIETTVSEDVKVNIDLENSANDRIEVFIK